MTKLDKIYTGLCSLFSVLVVIGNLTSQKFVFLPIMDAYTFELSVGAMVYPLTFLITDLITEFYGKDRAMFCVRLAISMNMIAALMVSIMNLMPATAWSKIDDLIFHKVFGIYGLVFIGSTVSCYIAQSIDTTLYLWIRRITGGKYLWLRNNGSTAVSLLIDTSIVVTFLTILGALPLDQMLPLIINSYSFKLFFTICSTPLFYLCVSTIRRVKNTKNNLHC